MRDGKARLLGLRQLIHRQWHSTVVLQVIEKKADGSPHTLKLLEDDDVVDLEGGEEFITAFIPEGVLRKRKAGTS